MISSSSIASLVDTIALLISRFKAYWFLLFDSNRLREGLAHDDMELQPIAPRCCQ